MLDIVVSGIVGVSINKIALRIMSVWLIGWLTLRPFLVICVLLENKSEREERGY